MKYKDKLIKRRNEINIFQAEFRRLYRQLEIEKAEIEKALR